MFEKKVREKLLILCKNIYLCFFLGGAFFFAGAFLGDFLAAFFLGEEAGGGLDFLATTSEIPGMIKLCLLLAQFRGKIQGFRDFISSVNKHLEKKE